jgi:tetratricopeptide (TPR) repeat protein
MSLSGNLKTMDLAELLQWVALGRKTGSLTFIREKSKNHIYFKTGQIISSRSNEPTKQLGHFLLFQGHITETQLKRALEVQLQTRSILGKILVQEGFVPSAEVEAALGERTREIIYDLFLWQDGYFQFTADGYDIRDLILVSLDVNSIIFEGVRRKDEWGRIREVFPSSEVVLGICPDVNLKVLAFTPLQRKLLYHVSLGKPVSDVILETHGSDFLVMFELFQLHQNGVVQIMKAPAPAKPAPEDPARPYKRGLVLMETGSFQEAIACFQEALRIDPRNAEAHEQIEIAERAICDDLYERSLPRQKVPYFLVSPASLTSYSLNHQEGFIASRVNGAWDVKTIVMLAPLREMEVLQTLERLIKMNILGLR